MNFYAKMMLSSLAVVLLSACGGGGGSGGGNTGGTTNPPSPTLSVSPINLSLSDSAVSSSFAVSSNTSWTVSDDADWLDLSPASGSNNADVAVTVTANSQASARDATITVTAGSLSRSVSVSQEAGTDPSFTYDVEPDKTGMRELTSVEFAALLGEGFNIGNSLDAINSQGTPEETAWGNPLINEALIKAIKAAGFDSIRLPVAWSNFSDPDNYVIDATWMARVRQVVDMALAEDLYVMLNIHWDGGWMQPLYSEQDEVNNRLDIMWSQIATEFRDYDDKLFFAGTNEVMKEGDYGTPTEEYYTVQNSFNQTFVTAVRKTGGRNAYRQLVVQGFNTNIDHTVNFAEIPDDVVEDRLLMEVHYYDPFQFTLNEENDDISQWGANATDMNKTAQWGDESFVDTQFDKMESEFIDNGIGVILGEFGVISRTSVTGHEAFRVDWNAYVVGAAKARGIVPFYWDNGHTGNHGLGIFNRATGEVVFPDIVDAVAVK